MYLDKEATGPAWKHKGTRWQRQGERRVTVSCKNDPIKIQMAAQTGTAEMAAPLRNLPRTPHLQLTLRHVPTVPPVPGSLMGTQ